MNLAIIGNCSYQALIDEHADVKWLCWPRFDSSWVFGGLLDGERGGEFSIRPRDPDYTTDQEYLPNTNVLRTQFSSSTGDFEVIDFAPRFRQYERYFKPNMLIRIVKPLSGRPAIRIRCRPVFDHGRSQPAAHLASNHIYWELSSHLRLTTNVSLSYLSEERAFLLEEPAYLCLTWGRPLEAPLAETCENFAVRTRRYWERWVKHGALPDKFQAEVVRSALVLKLHQYEDTGAVTAAATTSLPEHDGSGRNWDYRYCWLRDACFTLGALRRLGQFDEMEKFVTYLANIAAEGTERLQPVYGITGRHELPETELSHLSGYRGNRPVRVGNLAYAQEQHDVYGEMLVAIAPLFTNLRFRDLAGTHSTDLLHSLLARIDETLQRPDAGLWEKRDEPRVHTFSLLMHWAGARMAEYAGQRCGDLALSDAGRLLQLRARKLIEEGAWRDELGYYADALDTREADASLLMMVNIGFLEPGHPHAESHVRHLARALAADEHLLYRYIHHDGIGDTRSSFTVCSFWYAEALARLGYRDEAEQVFNRTVAHANHVGLLSEDIDPVTGAMWGNFPQTYSHVGLINAAFAISPSLAPLM